MKQEIVVEVEGPNDSVKMVIDKIFLTVIQEWKTGMFQSFSVYRKDVPEEKIRLPEVNRKKQEEYENGKINKTRQ